jgi:hypothetical protein
MFPTTPECGSSERLLYQLQSYRGCRTAPGRLPATRAALLRWVEGSFAGDALERAVEAGDKAAISKALKAGKVRAKGQGG